MTFTPEALLPALRAALSRSQPSVLVAYSGGLDSSVLLHALAQLRSQMPFELRAFHVNHQLHAAASQWADHCRQTARGLGVAIEIVAVEIDGVAEEGVEAAARRARYDALKQTLQPEECLVTAHHADDQAETMLLALVRGTGVRGAAGMRASRSFGAGVHVRPLLAFNRAELAAYASEHSIGFLDDPANQSVRFARNHMRSRVLPELRARWPHVARQFTQAAANFSEASVLLDQLAELDAGRCIEHAAVALHELTRLSAMRQKNLLRWWLRLRGARAPSAAKLAGLLRDMNAAAADRIPFVDVDVLRVYRYHQHLHAVPLQQVTAPLQRCVWQIDEPLRLPVGRLIARHVIGQGVARRWFAGSVTVQTRSGGERLRLYPGGPHRELKKLLQEQGVLPWWRDRVPLVYAGKHLLCVANLWMSADAIATRDEAGVLIEWEDAPVLISGDGEPR